MYHEWDNQKRVLFLWVWADLCAPFDVDELVAEAQHVGFLYDVAVPCLHVLFTADCLEAGGRHEISVEDIDLFLLVCFNAFLRAPALNPSLVSRLNVWISWPSDLNFSTRSSIIADVLSEMSSRSWI